MPAHARVYGDETLADKSGEASRTFAHKSRRQYRGARLWRAGQHRWRTNNHDRRRLAAHNNLQPYLC